MICYYKLIFYYNSFKDSNKDYTRLRINYIYI